MQLVQPGEVVNDAELMTGFEQVHSLTKNASYTPAKILQGVIGPLPISVLNYSSPAVSRSLSELLSAEPFDAVQVESIHLFKYLQTIRAAPNRPAILMDWHNIESELMWRYAEQTKNLPKKTVARRTASLLARVELKSLPLCDAHTVVSDRERFHLLERDPTATVHVIPNGVDTNFYASDDMRTVTANPPGSRQTLLFVGSMDYHANIDAVTSFMADIWPVLSREFPGLEFTIVGRNPPASIQAFASRRVHVAGTVDDVRPFYWEAFAAIVPLRVGGGTRLKILEAMAAGVPVISTVLGAEGLAAQDQVHVLLADSADQMASAIKSLQNSARRESLIDSARTLVKEQYDWAVIGERLMHLYAEIVEKRTKQDRPVSC